MYEQMIDTCTFMLGEMYYAKAQKSKLYEKVYNFNEKLKALGRKKWLEISNKDANKIYDEYISIRKEFKDRYGY